MWHAHHVRVFTDETPVSTLQTAPLRSTILRTAMDFTLARKGDALTLIPHFEAGSFWERVMIPTWTWVLLMFTLVYRISDPKTPGAVGIGGFFLIREKQG